MMRCCVMSCCVAAWSLVNDEKDTQTKGTSRYNLKTKGRLSFLIRIANDYSYVNIGFAKKRYVAFEKQKVVVKCG